MRQNHGISRVIPRIWLAMYDLFDDNQGFSQIVLVLNNLLLIVLFISNSQQCGSLILIVVIHRFIISSWMFL